MKPTHTYQVFSLGEGVLHVRETEAGHCDELAHHRHILIPHLLGTFLLKLQLLRGKRKEQNRLTIGQTKGRVK